MRGILSPEQSSTENRDFQKTRCSRFSKKCGIIAKTRRHSEAFIGAQQISMAGLYKRGKTWYVKYTLDGKAIRKSVSRDKRTASEFKAHLETQISRKHLSLPVFNYSWTDFVQKYLDFSRSHKRLKTFEIDEASLESFSKFAKPRTTGDITVQKLEDWKSQRLREISPTSVNMYLCQLKACFRKATEWGLMDLKQFASVKQAKEMKRIPRFLSHEEIGALQSVTPARWWRMFYTMMCTGLRLGEFLHLKWSQVDFERKVIRIQDDGNWVPKDYEMREIPLYPDLASVLVKIKHENGTGKYIFHEGPVNGTLVRRIERKLQNYCKKAGLRRCRIHDLRHTFASHLVMEGVDLLTVRDLLGHSSVKTTEIYAHLSQGHRQLAIGKLRIGTQFSTQAVS